MLETFFEAPFTINRLRASPLVGNYIDGFAQNLDEQRYAIATARRYLRASGHLGHFVKLKNIELNAINSTVIKDFQQHLPECCCPQSNGGTTKDVERGAKHFLEYLQSIGCINTQYKPQVEGEYELVKSFRNWLDQHRGLSQSTLYKYCRDADKLITALGEDVSQFNAKKLRDFLLKQAKQQGSGATKTLISALRMFLRYLASQKKCQAGLERAIPTLANWGHASLPNYLQTNEVQRILDVCDVNTVMGVRDRAIILLLVRLGLRAGDVAGLQLTDIDWSDGSLVVSGKNNREVRLPLPQDVGDAILSYLQCRQFKNKAVFLRSVAPYRPFSSGSSLSSIVTRAMHRAGVVSSRYGAHLLRNTAATQMLQQGASLYEISTILRHKTIDMTARYTKVDLSLLNLVIQPWPEVLQ